MSKNTNELCTINNVIYCIFISAEYRAITLLYNVVEIISYGL